MMKFSFSDIRAEADEILRQARGELDRAHAEAREIIERAKIQVEGTRQEAQAEGFQSGYKQGLSEGTQKGREQGLEQAKKDFSEQNVRLRGALESLLRTFESDRNHLMAQAHQDLLALALAMAAKVTRRQLQADPDLGLEIIKNAVGLVGSRSAVTIRVNPDDADRFEVLDPELAKSTFGLEQVKVVKDASVEAGGCVVATDNGSIDAQVSTQLDNLIGQLAPALEASVKAWAKE